VVRPYRVLRVAHTHAPARRDWLTHQHRDTLASIVGHPTLTSFLAIADGEATGRVKFEMMQVRTAPVCVAGGADGVQRMLQPCGPPPPKDED
jgi:hypothetical protein